VDPGVTVEFSGLGLDVQGALSALGTASEPITLTSAATTPHAGDWYSLQFEAGSVGALSYTTISDAGSYCGGCGLTPNASVGVQGTVSLDHVTVTQSGYDGIAVAGSSNVSVTNSTVSGSGNSGLVVSDPSTPTISNSLFGDNGGRAIELSNPDSATNLAHNRFSGNGFDGVHLDGGMLTQSTTWPATSGPIELGGYITVGSTTTLTIAADATIRGSNYSELDVQGTLNAVGTANQPITFTSGLSPTNPGDWYGLQFEPGSFGHLSYTSVAYGGDAGCYSPTYYSSFCGALYLSGAIATLDHVTVTHSSQGGILAIDGGRFSVSDSTLSNNGSYGIDLPDSNSSVPTSSITGTHFLANGLDAVYLSNPDAMPSLANNIYNSSSLQ